MYDSGFDAMGKPIPMHRRTNADNALKEMGMASRTQRFDVIQKMASLLEQDSPFEAMAVLFPNDPTKNVMDLTATYRVMAHLLTD